MAAKEQDGKFSKRVGKMQRDREAEKYRQPDTDKSIIPEFKATDSPNFVLLKLLKAYSQAVGEGNVFALQQLLAPTLAEKLLYLLQGVKLGEYSIHPVLSECAVELISHDGKEWKLLLSYVDRTEYHNRNGEVTRANPGEDVSLIVHMTKGTQPCISAIFEET